MPITVRWLRFNVVGVMGFAVQASTLSVLLRWTGLGTSVAIALAVLAAVTHNFIWHELFTYPGRPARWRAARWIWFNLSAGLLAVVSNVAVTTLVISVTGLPVVVSNLIAVLVLSALNFLVSDQFIFRAWSHEG